MAVWVTVVILFLMVQILQGFAKEFNIAFFAPSSSEYQFNASSSVGALVNGLVDVQDKFNLLQGHTLRVTWYDSRCDNKEAAGLAADVYDRGEVDVFIGPPCSEAMVSVAALASYWNLPVFGWFSADQELNDKTKYTTLVRTFGPLQQLGLLFGGMFEAFGWKRTALVTTFLDESLAIFDAIEDYFLSIGIRVSRTYRLPPNARADDIKPVLKDIQKHTRIVMLSVPPPELRTYLLAAYDLDMTSGDFAFIAMQLLAGNDYWNHGNETWQGDDGRDLEARQAMEALLYVTLGDNLEMYLGRERYEAFLSQGMRRANSPPWNQSLPTAAYGDVFSTYLYDAVYLWAQLTDGVLKEGKDPRDGEELARRARGHWFNGSSSLDIVTMNDNADRNADFLILDQNSAGVMWPVALLYWTIENNTATQEMQFFTDIIWPDGSTGYTNVPPDTPLCGFDGSLCPDNTAVIIVSTLIVLVVLIVLGSIIIIILYRRRKFEKTLNRNLWMVNFDDIKLNYPGRLAGSRRTLVTANSMMTLSLTSGSCDLIGELPRGQVFTQAAVYKGALVAVRKPDRDHVKITRDFQLEMCYMKEISHVNLNAFVGACVEPRHVCVLWQYCQKGSLQDVIWDENLKLDIQFKLSIAYDIIKGMQYLHSTELPSHGRLKSSNVLLDSRWSAKITDYGMSTLLAEEQDENEVSDYASYARLFWTAPELLRVTTGPFPGTKLGDVYSFGIIMKELTSRNSPYTEFELMSPEEIISKIKDYKMPEQLTKRPASGKIRTFKSQKKNLKLETTEPPPFRPSLEKVDMKGLHPKRHGALLQLITSCWAEVPDERPSFGKIHKTFLKWKGNMCTNVLDNMVTLLEKYADNLEELVTERTEQLQEEKQKTDMLLYRMLPRSVAERLKQGQTVQAEWFDDVTVYFSDVVGFTNIAAASTPMQVVALLNSLYTLFDDIITHHDVYKVETIGDAYMLASGLPVRNESQHVCEVANCSLDLLSAVATRFSIPHLPDIPLSIRIGLHTGPCAAGVVGLAMPRYCLFGDTVNTASRMESNGEAMKIHISASTQIALSQFPGYEIEVRGELQIKGKGAMTTYWLKGRQENSQKYEPDVKAAIENDASTEYMNVDPLHAPQVSSSSL